jgi:hypothetical protein
LRWMLGVLGGGGVILTGNEGYTGNTCHRKVVTRVKEEREQVREGTESERHTQGADLIKKRLP